MKSRVMIISMIYDDQTSKFTISAIKQREDEDKPTLFEYEDYIYQDAVRGVINKALGLDKKVN